MSLPITRAMKSKRRLVSFLLVWALLTLCVSYFAPKIRYLAELEPPARYWSGRRARDVNVWSAHALQLIGCFSHRRSLLMGGRRHLPYCVTERLPSACFYLSPTRNCPLQWLASKSPPR